MAEIIFDGQSLQSMPPDVPVMQQMDGLRYMYTDYGFKWDDGIGPNGLWLGVGRAFVGPQVPPPSQLEELPVHMQTYFERTVQPVLARDFRAGRGKAIEIAQQVGHVFGAIGLARPDNAVVPVRITDNTLVIEGREVAHDGVNGRVVEYGIGMNGVDSHIRNLQAGRYVVSGMVHGDAEAEVLDAARAHMGFSEEQLMIECGGLMQCIGDMVDNGDDGKADLVIASRVHAAGDELRFGIDAAATLLRVGGLLVACGPRVKTWEDDYDYDFVGEHITGLGGMEVVWDESFDKAMPKRPLEPNRLVVARKI